MSNPDYNIAEKFSKYTTEYLLKQRGRGDDLSDEVHSVIEDILSDRGVSLPRRPKQSVDIKNGLSWSESRLLSFILVIVALFSIGLAKVLGHTWIGLVILSVVYYGYLLLTKIKELELRRTMTEKEWVEHQNIKAVEEKNLSDLMIASGEGDLKRAMELLAYGADVNEKTFNGETALMFAVRNNRFALVELLLSKGADKNIRIKKGVHACGIAQEFKQEEIAKLLDSYE